MSPTVFGPAAGTGTSDCASTAQSGRICSGGREHCQLRLNVTSLPWDLGEALPDVAALDLPGRGLSQTFPTGLSSPPTSASSSPRSGDRLRAQPFSCYVGSEVRGNDNSADPQPTAQGVLVPCALMDTLVHEHGVCYSY